MSAEMSTTKKENVWAERNSIEPKMKSDCSGGLEECGITKNTDGSKDNVPSIDTICTKKISGVYKIINRVNNKYYVGSSVNVNCGKDSRWNQHKRHLRNNNHENKYLQYSYNKYGVANFEYVMVEECVPGECLSIEQKYLDVARRDYLNNKCYNLKFVAVGGDGLNEKSKQKRIDSLRRYYHAHKNIMRRRLKDRMKHRRSPVVYVFRNRITDECFTGTQYDFYTQYELNNDCVNGLVRGWKKSYKNWVLV